MVLKVFGGYQDCSNQPDAWHQYGPAVPVSHVAGDSYNISAGIWRADERAVLDIKSDYMLTSLPVPKLVLESMDANDAQFAGRNGGKPGHLPFGLIHFKLRLNEAGAAATVRVHFSGVFDHRA